MTRLQRIRLWLAERLVVGTGREIVISEHFDTAHLTLWDLSRFVRSSGGLASPPRVMARRKITMKLEQLNTALGSAREAQYQ